jgi:integrase
MRRSPHIYSAAEIDRLIEAALRLRPKGGLRSRTYATLIALLSVTGLRIIETFLNETLARQRGVSRELWRKLGDGVKKAA